MNLLIYALSFLAISQLLLMGLYYLGYYRQHFVARLLALLCLGLIATIILVPSTLGGSFSTQYVLGLFVYATPAVLWLTAHFFFEDEHGISPLMWLILLGYQTVRAIGLLLLPERSETFTQFSYAIMLGLMVHVIVIALRGKSGDLVEPRRQLREPFSVCLGGILAGVISMAAVVSLIPGDTQNLIQGTIVVFFTLLFLFALSINLATLKIAGQSVSLIGKTLGKKPSARGSAEKQQAVSPRILAKLRELMEEQKLYRDSQLTIVTLAAKVHATEHKLRRVINNDLGHRNFSQFLNQYRVREAKELLLESAQAPIYDIALQVGYASLSSFNKAFKNITGMTPTCFRNEGGDSTNSNEVSVK